MRPRPIYLDYNGTTPVNPEVLEAMLPWLREEFGNPSSKSVLGIRAKDAVETARSEVANLISAWPDEILFTSGGTESNNHAIIGGARLGRKKGRHIVTSAIEHPAVTEVCRFLANEEGFEVTAVPVDREGIVLLKDIEAAIRPDTVLISVMHSNNEIGTLQPIGEIGRLARERGILFHTDAAQSPGKVSVDVRELQVDLLSIAGHKLYAPKGTGALFIRRGVDLPPFMHGAGQQQGRRAGTENVPGWVALGKASQVAARDLEEASTQMRAARDHLHESLQGIFPNLVLNGHYRQRLPNTLSVSFPGLGAYRLLEAMGDKVSASSGSACHSGRTTISPVLAALGVDEAVGTGTIRFSTGKNTTLDETKAACSVLSQILGNI
ncbi:MAG: cysteine desulfurase family protein [Opitutales bacterium]